MHAQLLQLVRLNKRPVPLLQQQHASSHVTRHTSHVTRHTSHVTRHTSHVTRHTSHSYQPQRSFSHTRGGHVSAHHVQPSPRTTQYVAAASGCMRMRLQHVTRLPGTTQRAGTLRLRSTCTPPSTTVRTPTAVTSAKLIPPLLWTCLMTACECDAAAAAAAATMHTPATCSLTRSAATCRAST